MFNNKQSQVINELTNNILLLAPAGTGKTNTLAERVKKIIDDNMASPDEILCITFTNKACKEMKSRVTSHHKDGNRVDVYTFHGFCHDIIKHEAKKHLDVPSDFNVYDEEDSLAMMEPYCEEGVPHKDVKAVINFIRENCVSKNIFSRSKIDDYNQVVDILCEENDEYQAFLSGFKNNRQSIDLLFKLNGATYTNDYINKLRLNRAIDFQDIMNLTYELLLDEDIVNKYSSKYKYINIDEMQDTSEIEYGIVEKIFKNNNILLCGDHFQTIYAWRGSNPTAIFEKFIEKYNPIEIAFDCNYRATRMLTDFSSNYLNSAFGCEASKFFKEGIQSHSEDEGSLIPLYKAQSTEDEAKWIIDKLLELPEEERTKACILTRSNVYNVTLSTNLRNIVNQKCKGEKKINFALVDDTKFFKKTEVKDITAFLKLCANHTDSNALKRILKLIPYNIGVSSINKIESPLYRENGVLLCDLIDANALENKDKFKTLTDELDNNNVIVFDVESTGTDTTRDEIIQIAAIRIDNQGREIDRFMKFLKTDKPVGSSESVHGFSDEFLKENGEDKINILTEFLDFIKDTVIVGHNVQYDINILTSELSRKNLPSLKIKTFYDTLDIYRRFCPDMENHKLETISNIIDTEHKPNHDALYDILATAEILISAVDTHIRPTAEKRVELMNAIPDRFKAVADDMTHLFHLAKNKRPCDIIKEVVNSFKILKIFGSESQKADNLREFYFTAKLHDDANLSPRDSLLDFTNLTALSDGEMERLLTKQGKTPILTIHQSKGLEFQHVFLAGLQNYTFPSYFAMKSSSFEEEKRLMYVACTRAKKSLFLSYSLSVRGNTQKASQLLDDIDYTFVSEEN